MELLHDIWEWAVAVFENWHGYVSGGLVAFVLEYGEKLWDWKPPKKWIWVILIMGFLFSIFSAWREQFRRANEAEKTLNEKVPKLIGDIQYYFVGVMQGKSSVGIIATISNLPTGVPSIARAYTLKIKLLSGKKFAGEATFIPQTVTLNTANGPKHYYQEDALYTKTAVPIPAGGAETGLLVFVLPDLAPKDQNTPPKELKETGTIVTLEFQDVNRKLYSCSMTVEKMSDEFKYYPGMRPPS